MLEFLQPLVDAVTKALPAFARKRERDAAAKLGAELFLVYTQLNEALVLAEKIVGTLEHYVERMADGDRYAPDLGQSVAVDIQQQVRNLITIRNRIERWGWELQVLDGATVNELWFLLDVKLSVLRALAGAVDDGHVPLRTEGILIDERGVLRAGFNQDLDRFYRLHTELVENSVPSTRPWGPEVLATVRTYLAARRPRQQLAEIRTALEKIRTVLESNFTITDILLRAGDPRANRDWRLH